MATMTRHSMMSLHVDAAPLRAMMCCRMLQRDAATA
jgi:hypothetical protein